MSTYGQNAYGSRDQDNQTTPYLKSSIPANGATQVNRSGAFVLVFSSPAGIDTATINVTLNGAQAVVNGVFVAPFTGTIETDVEDCTVTFTAHPLFVAGANSTSLSVTDLGGVTGTPSLSFSADSFTVPISETVTFSEGQQVSHGQTQSNSEGVSLVDLQSAAAGFLQSISESAITVSEAVSTSYGTVVAPSENVALSEGAVFVSEGIFVAAAETVSLSDAVGLNLGIVVNKTEAISVSEALGNQQSFWLDLPDVISVSEVADAVKGFGVPINESLTLSEHLGLLFDYTQTNVEALPFVESFTARQPFTVALAESVPITEGVPEQTDVHIFEHVPFLESVSIGIETHESGFTVTIHYPLGLLLDGILTSSNYWFVPLGGAYPLTIDFVEPTTTAVTSGAGGSVVATSESFFSRRFQVPSGPTTANIGDYLQFSTPTNPNVSARILDVTATFTATYIDVDQNLVVADPMNGSIPWDVLRVDGVLIHTTKPTDGALYQLYITNLFKRDGTPFEGSAEFTGAATKPRLSSVEALSDGQLILTYSEAMRFDASLMDPAEYNIIGPGTPKVVGARALSPTQLLLQTHGIEAGNCALEVNATGTPKDVAGNPIDPTFNLAAFTSTDPVTLRSVFTDRGPIAKPPLSLQNGSGASVASFTEVTLPGASLTPSVVGKYLSLGGVTNGGDYKITGMVNATRARVQASFTYPDPDSGTLTWDIYDPRDGQIADDPADVTVRVNSTPITPEAVIGLLGQIVLNTRPAPTDDVKVDYSWVCNPEIEIRRLNSKEFRLNNWNRDIGRPNDASMHKYRFNNVLITPALYVPDDPQAWLAQPQQRDLKYRAYERAYSALLNDPNLLLLNSPTQKIAFPPLSRYISSTFVSYDALVLPEADATYPWTRKGSGLASVSGGELRVQDISGGPFPLGNPVFWVRPIDITFPCVYASTWRMRITADPVTEGVFTGVAAGYSGGEKALLLGYLDDGGTKKLGFLKKGYGNDLGLIAAWAGGLDSLGNPTGAPIDWDWSVEHSYRLYKDSSGVTKLYVDGGVTEVLRVTEAELPYLEELAAPFNALEGTFFGSLSRPAMNTSYWTFVRYAILPTNPYQSLPSEYVSYEGTTEPEAASQPWTPIGYHGTETILSGDFLLLDSTSATDAATESLIGLIEGDFRGFTRLEPLLSAAAEVVLDVNVQLRTFTHGITPNAVTAAIDDGDRLIQLSLFPKVASPKFSYGGRCYPEDWTPIPWSSAGTATAEMVGRTLRITDTSITDGRVYYVDDTAAPAGDLARVVSASNDYALEFRVKVQSYIADPGGFCGATADIYDSSRTLGVFLQEVGGIKYVAFHSDGVPIGVAYAFDWGDGEFHTYRITKRAAVPNPIVSLFIDGVYATSADYTLFTTPPYNPTGVISFGSSTTASSMARSVVDWVYCNCWKMQTSFRTFVGLWRGYDADSLTGYHLPTKVTGRDAAVGGNVLYDPLADFSTAAVLPGDSLVVDVGSNKGTYEVSSIVDPQTLTITALFPSTPSTVAYRIIKEIDWATAHKYRIVKDPGGGVSVFLDAETAPLIHIGYNNMELPPSSSGLFRGIAGGLPSISFGAFDPTNLSQTSWDYVRFGITRSVSELRIVPHHQILNQRNVMASPEHLFTMIPHTHTDYWASSTGIPPQTDPDFLKNPGLIAFTLLNEGTPLVPTTQTAETRAGYDLIPVLEPLSGLNRPEDVLGSQAFVLNDATTRYKLNIPDDVLYNSLKVIETKTGETSLIKPFCDECDGPHFGPIYFQNEVCLWYEGDVLPELDPTAPTPWVFEADDDTHVSRSAFSGILTYGTDSTGTKTIYRNATPLPDSAGLETEARFRLKLLNDGSSGLGDTQVRFGLSAPGMTVGLAFVTTPLGERYILVRDLNLGIVVGGIPFDFGDGAFHTYRIVRDIRTASVRIYVDS